MVRTTDDLISTIAASTSLPQDTVKKIVAGIFAGMTSALAHGENVRLDGFFAMSVRKRQARTGKNIKTGEIIHITEAALVAFNAGRQLRDAVNK